MKPVRRMSARLAEVRASFWLVPALFAVGAVGAAIGLSLLELQLDIAVDWLLPSGPAGARSLLSSIITAMISFTALVFSITVVALQLASSQYSPRVLRTFLQDRIIQATLGTFVATFLFAMVVLAALPAREEARLPELSLAVSMALVLGSTGMFLYYLHHITQVMRVSHIITSIGAQTRDTIAAHLPETGQPEPSPLGDVVQVVRTERPGMVVTVDTGRLARLAAGHGCALSVVPVPGDFVTAGAPLLRVHRVGDAPVRSLPVDQLVAGVTIGPERSPGQDVGFGFRQLTDIAERALSPSTNDVTTATRAVQEAHDLLRRLATRPDGAHLVRDDSGTVRVRVDRLPFDTYLAMVVDDVRAAAGDQPRVNRLLDAVLTDLASVALPAHLGAVLRRTGGGQSPSRPA
ncbi:DUF2254 domain-containing protein [Micromonospora sp. WMMD882]|uniref:DUF2254 domain-containing protein n=1 Tax=Micromonospora sp. WMMD882 TaxID=3015151 RepID=UPI00248C1D2B|nr:DUF2254 domain-containing protein [Micromonospora sp. WMMD882]WBB78091.1 DUF2254 domain-containing protein [Micromonospora sp. WMMD882]